MVELTEGFSERRIQGPLTKEESELWGGFWEEFWKELDIRLARLEATVTIGDAVPMTINNAEELKAAEQELERYALKDEATLTPEDTKRLDELANAVYEYEESTHNRPLAEGEGLEDDDDFLHS